MAKILQFAPLLMVGVAIIWASNIVPGGPIALPPYLKMIGNLYVPADNMYQATLPPASLTGWGQFGAGGVTKANGANGDVLLTATMTTPSFFSAPSQIISIELSSNCVGGTNSATPICGIYVWDSTNSKLYSANLITDAQAGSGITTNTYTYNGSGSPSFSSQDSVFITAFATTHLKGAVSAGTLTFSYSQNGGTVLSTQHTYSVGTIGNLGVVVGGPATHDLYSIVVN